MSDLGLVLKSLWAKKFYVKNVTNKIFKQTSAVSAYVELPGLANISRKHPLEFEFQLHMNNFLV